MPTIIRAPKRLIDLDDVVSLLSELADGHALVYDHDAGTFGLVHLASNAHASQHASGGSDTIKLDDLATPDDNTDLDATTGRHGLLPKLAGGTSTFLRADGSWATAGGAGASFSDAEGDPANVSDNAADGTSVYAARRDHVHTIGAGVVSSTMLADGAALAEILDDDGTGSLLDADLLDGSHASAFATSGHTHEVDQRADVFSDAEGDAAAVSTTAADGTSTYAARRDHVHDLTATTVRALGFFDTSNDGTGSGLDSDTVDGSHASAFATSGHNHDVAYATAAHTHEVDQRADMFSDAEGDPAAVGTAADGTSVYASRRDHVHAATHGALSGVGANDHHNQAHVLDGGDHTVSGLTSGHFLKATGAAAFGFAAHGLGYSDVGAASSGHNHDASYATAAHTHEVDQRADVFSDAEGDPANIGSVADGTSTYAARRDHVHAIGSGTVTAAMLEDALDLGGKTSVEIPNGAGGTTVDAAGEVTIDSTSRTLNFYDGTAEVVLNPVKHAAFLLESPAAADDLPIFRFDVAVTLIKTVYAIAGGTNWVGQVQEANDAQGTSAADTQSADSTVASNTTVTSYSNASFDAGDYATLKTTSVSGSVTWLHVTIYWRENP